MHDNHYLVPTQQEGLEKNISHHISAPTIEDAEDWFVDGKERLLAVNHWKKWSAGLGMETRLTDSHGNALNRSARKGDHIRIALPEQDGGGFDWVVIDAIAYDDYPDISMETFGIRLRHAADPMNRTDGDVNSQFYSDATSTFVIERAGKRLTAAYHGRNEVEDIDAGVLVASCAWLGLTDVQCAALVKGFIV
jgi:hypothetical protein